MGVTQRALDALDDETCKRVNHLHALESGAEELFARAEALEDLAQQAQGDRARQLFAQAKAARGRAEKNENQLEQEQRALEADQEAREDATRRAARQGLQTAERQIDATAAALAAYSSGNGSGGSIGGDTMTAKDKLQLAGQVAKSERLKQIAALCGRMTRIALDVEKMRVKHPPDEITSITIGADLAHILPSEIALLSDPLLEDLFFLKYSDGRLMQYDLQGRDREGRGRSSSRWIVLGVWRMRTVARRRKKCGAKPLPWRSWRLRACKSATWRSFTFPAVASSRCTISRRDKAITVR